MLFYVRIREGLKARVDELVSRGLYSDLNAVVDVALQNLVTAEDEHSRDAAPPTTVKPKKKALVERSEREAAASGGKDQVQGTSDTDHTLPILNWVGALKLPDQLVAPEPADLFRSGQRVPVERWIFGQQNRALPAKVNARLFVLLVEKRQAEIELFEAASDISKQAGSAFRFFNKVDKRLGHGKDNQLSTGFPEPESDKAMSRYANHFVAYESSQGNLTGMLLQWKLAGVKRVKNKTFLLPTQDCIVFAALPNPLLDSPIGEKPVEKFSGEELAWVTEHIASKVPVEAAAFRAILAGLEKGCNTPDGLDQYVRKNAMDKVDVTEAFVSTQRSGAVSRMADLNLVKRQRDGTKISYEMTEAGAAWLEKHGVDLH